MPRIELVHFRGCPHVASARDNLGEALRACDLGQDWTEVDLDSETVPDHARGLPSPTVLVDGRDVEPVDGPGAGRACRAGGAPSTTAIVQALRDAGGSGLSPPAGTSGGPSAS